MLAVVALVLNSLNPWRDFVAQGSGVGSSSQKSSKGSDVLLETCDEEPQPYRDSRAADDRLTARIEMGTGLKSVKSV